MSSSRIPWLLVIASLFFWGRVVAHTPSKTPERVEDVAQCALDCLDQFVDAPISSEASEERLCHDTSFNLEVTNCVRKACDVNQVLEYLRMEQEVCARPDLDNAHNIRAIIFFILGVAVTAVALRIITKIYRFTRWGLDDYFIIVASVLTVLQCSMIIAMTYEGLGHNIWTVDQQSIFKFSMYLPVVEFAYILSLCLIKVSILCFFHRTFPDPRFRTILVWTIGFNVLSTIVICILAGLHSSPTQPTQEGWKDDTSTGSKLDIQLLVLSHAAVNVALDIWMFILPLTQLYHIGLKTKKKIGVMLIFSVGIFLITVSCLRISFMVDFNRSLNATAASQGILVWSNIESGVGILVACLPHTQPLLRAAMTRARPLNPFSKRPAAQGIFIDRPLATIIVTALDGTTVTRADDLVLTDIGGLLTIDDTSTGKRDTKSNFGSHSQATTV